jgi:hypothetical protein
MYSVRPEYTLIYLPFRKSISRTESVLDGDASSQRDGGWKLEEAGFFTAKKNYCQVVYNRHSV